MKTQKEHMQAERGGGQGSDKQTDHSIEHPTLDREAIGRRAYLYWEERGCPNDSPDEDWFRAEAEIRHHLSVAASHS